MTDAQIRNMIYTVRGEQVMLDSDLAELYGVETRTLNQAVTRNPDRFPERFCFRLTKDEAENLTSQIVMLGAELGKRGDRWTHMPRVFTEQGVSMLSAVLRSKTAVAVSVRIMDAFAEMRHFIADNAHMFDQIRRVELKQAEYQKSTDERFERVFDYMEAHEEPRQKVFFEGQVYDAFELLVSLVQRARREIVLIDGYVDAGTLNILAKKAEASPSRCGPTRRRSSPPGTSRPSTRSTRRCPSATPSPSTTGSSSSTAPRDTLWVPPSRTRARGASPSRA